MESSKYTILVVDDEELIRNLMATFLSKMGYSSVTATDGVDALDKLKENKIDAVVTDAKMPRMDGIDLTMAISKEYHGLPIMISTAYGEEYSIATAICVGAKEFIQKPFSFYEFAIRLRKMIHDSEASKRRRTETNEDGELEKLRLELEDILKRVCRFSS
jgi:DNA-binding response OmpR family regulator